AVLLSHAPLLQTDTHGDVRLPSASCRPPFSARASAGLILVVVSAARRSPADGPGVVTHPSPVPVSDMVRRLVNLMESKSLKVFAVVDHSGEATRAGLHMNDTQLIVFGSPAAGTPVMVAAPLAALDLPLKVLVC